MNDLKFSHIKINKCNKEEYVFKFIKDDEDIYFYTTTEGESIKLEYYNNPQDLILLCLEVITRKDFIKKEIKKARLKKKGVLI